MSVVFTIGYEGTDIERFIATIKNVGIQTIVDVRAIALSRKPGFSKTMLANRLHNEGIEYIHYIDLGDPKPGREAARAGRFDEFRCIYSNHLSTDKAQKALTDLGNITISRIACLLCFERDPSTCHRTLVAEKLCANGIDKFDLYGDLPRRYDNFEFRGGRPRQSAAAA